MFYILNKGQYHTRLINGNVCFRFNSVSATGLKGALKRAAEIIKNKFSDSYNLPTADLIESVVNSSSGDVRSAILNLHFASLKGNYYTFIDSFFESNTKSKQMFRSIE